MKPIDSILREILQTDSYDENHLAVELGVSASTVRRWLGGDTKPRAIVEGSIRAIHQQVTMHQARVEELQLPLSATDKEVSAREALDGTLRELREILHRRGRMSGRNEALTEISKLLFAHIMSADANGRGIARTTVLGARPGFGEAEALRQFVGDVLKRHLPVSLAHEMEPSDFELRIKPQEQTLAQEIIDCFESFTPIHSGTNNPALSVIDVLNEAFGRFLVDSFIDEKELGQYLTPPEVVRFMVRLALKAMPSSDFQILCSPRDCSSFGLFLDPACGVGSFLVELLRTLWPRVLADGGLPEAEQWLSKMLTEVVVGIDKSDRMVQLALANIAIFGFPAARLHLANSLARVGPDGDLTASLEGKVRLILTNPPFGAEFQGHDLEPYKIAGEWATRPQRKVESELLFLERYTDWLAPGGQFLAIVPDSILTNKGIFENLRHHLATVVEVQSVISLPNVTFQAAGTNTKTSILHVRKRTSGVARHTTFFAVCENVGYSVATKKAHRTKVPNGTNDLARILDEYEESDEVFTVYGRRVVGVEKSLRWDATYHASLPREIETRLRNGSSREMVFVSDVATLPRDRADPRRWGTGTFPYIEISDVDSESLFAHPKAVQCSEAPSRARKLVRSGDVLFSTVRPERRTVAVVREDQDRSVCSTGFAVLRPKDIDPFILGWLLRTDFVITQVMRNNSGIAYPAVDEGTMLGILLPIRRDDLRSMTEQARSVAAMESELRHQRDEFSKRISDAVTLWAARP